MLIPKNSSKVTSLGDMKSLLSSNEAIGLRDYVLRKAEDCEPLDMAVISGEHANSDSLPLRYGMYFRSDAVITLKKVDVSRKPQSKQDRVALDAFFDDRLKVRFWYVSARQQKLRTALS